MDTPNKSARFCSNILGDTTLQILRSEKTRKISLVPIPRYENLADLFLILLGHLQMSSKGFHLYSFIKLSKNEALRDEPLSFYRGVSFFEKCKHFFSIFPCCKQFILQPQHLQTIFFACFF